MGPVHSRSAGICPGASPCVVRAVSDKWAESTAEVQASALEQLRKIDDNEKALEKKSKALEGESVSRLAGIKNSLHKVKTKFCSLDSIGNFFT